jgi:hypothetical protein
MSMLEQESAGSTGVMVLRRGSLAGVLDPPVNHAQNALAPGKLTHYRPWSHGVRYQAYVL